MVAVQGSICTWKGDPIEEIEENYTEKWCLIWALMNGLTLMGGACLVTAFLGGEYRVGKDSICLRLHGKENGKENQKCVWERLDCYIKRRHQSWPSSPACPHCKDSWLSGWKGHPRSSLTPIYSLILLTRSSTSSPCLLCVPSPSSSTYPKWWVIRGLELRIIVESHFSLIHLRIAVKLHS